MVKLFYRGAIEKILRQKAYFGDKRKKVKLVSLVDRKGNQWYYIFIGTTMRYRAPELIKARAFYDSL